MLQAWADCLDQLRTQGLAAATSAASRATSRPARAAPPPAHEPVHADAAAIGAAGSAASMARELSRLEAAKFLNVAHGVVVREIDGGRLKSHQVGVDLRIRLSDLVDFAVESRLNA